MVLHKHEPVPEADMRVTSPVHSICETLRDMYQLADELPESQQTEKIKVKARLTVAQAKAMSAKLVEYSGDRGWFRNFWDRK